MSERTIFVLSHLFKIAKDSLINADAVEKALKMLHTTSPSLMLLASLDAARATLQSRAGQAMLDRAIKNAKYLRTRLDNIPRLHQLKSDFGYMTDVTKVFIKMDGLSGSLMTSTILEPRDRISKTVSNASPSGSSLVTGLLQQYANILQPRKP